MYEPTPNKEKILNAKPSEIDKLGEQELKRYIYWRGFFDIEFFIDYFLGHYKTDKKTGNIIKSAPFHSDLLKLLQSNNDTLVIIPRDHAKSTTSFFVMIHDIVYKKEKSILLIMSEGLGVETIGKIRDEFETNKRILSVFGRLIPNRTTKEANKKRTQKQLDFLNGVCIETITMGGSVRGKRPTKLVVDDPQENKDVRNPIITENFNNWFFSSVYNTLDPTGRCILIGTVVGSLCLVNTVLQEGRGFKSIKYEAVKNPVYEGQTLIGGDPLRPEKRSLESLNKRLQTIRRDNFQQEYMNIPYILNGRPVFPLDKISSLIEPKREKDSKYPGLRIYNNTPGEYARGCDTADGGIGGDYSTITIRDKELGLVACYRGHIISEDYVKLLEYIIEEYKFEGLIGIEKNRPQVIELAKQKYWSILLYRTKTIDSITNKSQYKYGFSTTRQSKDLIIDNAVNKMYKKENQPHLTEIDERTQKEMENYYYDENGKANGISPYHDDLVMSDMICLHMVDNL